MYKVWYQMKADTPGNVMKPMMMFYFKVGMLTCSITQATNTFFKFNYLQIVGILLDRSTEQCTLGQLSFIWIVLCTLFCIRSVYEFMACWEASGKVAHSDSQPLSILFLLHFAGSKRSFTRIDAFSINY